MRRIGWAGLLAIGPICFGAWIARADDAQEADKTDRVLSEWQRRASSITSIEAKFLLTYHAEGWDKQSCVGRGVLASPNRALVDCTQFDENGKATDRREKLLYTAEEGFYFDYQTRVATQISRPTGKHPQPPKGLYTLFMFRTSVAEAKEGFDWKLLDERPDRYVLSATTKARFWLIRRSRHIIELDRATLLPRTIAIDGGDGTERRTYELSGYRINHPPNADDLSLPCLDPWKVIGRGIRPDGQVGR